MQHPKKTTPNFSLLTHDEEEENPTAQESQESLGSKTKETEEEDRVGEDDEEMEIDDHQIEKDVPSPQENTTPKSHHPEESSKTDPEAEIPPGQKPHATSPKEK